MTERPFPPLLVRASAGSGKTFRLVVRFIGLLAAGVEARRVLATTFTRKAAGEILSRVMERLADAALSPADLAALNRDLPDGISLDEARAAALLDSVARALPALRVETLDAFFHHIAAGHAFELGLPPGWGIGDPATLARLRRRAIADLLERDPEAAVALMRRLSKGDVRRSVVEQLDGLVADLHRHWLESPETAWDTFEVPPSPTDAEVDRAREALDDAPLPLNAKGEVNGHWRKAHTTLLRAIDSKSPREIAANGIVKKVLDGENTYYGQAIDPAWPELLAVPLARARHRELRELRDQNLASRDLIASFDECERHRRDEAGRYDFGTVTRLLAGARGEWELVEIYDRLDARIDHLLLDEFQDTSRLQYAVLEPVVDEIVSAGETGAERTFFCVGDVKQAIYGWRGGCRALFDVLEDRLPPGSTESLDRSWRSSPVVLDAVNRIFGAVETTFGDETDTTTARRWRDAFQTHVAAHPERPGFVELRIADREEHDDDIRDADLPLARTVDTVRTIRAADPRATVGVLLRRNDRVRELIDLLREQGIEASEEGGNPLTDSPPVSRILSALRLADHPGDRCELFAVARSPLGARIGLARDDTTARSAIVARDLRRDLLAEGYGPVVAHLAAELSPAASPRDRARLEQLVELAHRFGDETGLRPGDFVERVRRTSVESPTGAPVVVMTIHGAKGLEFDAVVLPQLTDSWFSPPDTLFAAASDPAAPADRLCRSVSRELRSLCGDAILPIYAGHRAETITEALSVLYVALTRARHALHLLLPPGKLRDAPSFARIVRLALGGDLAEENGAGETVLFANGDPEWAARVAEERAAEETRAEPRTAPARIAVPPRGDAGRAPSEAGATATPPSARAPSGRAEGPAPPGGRAARRLGTTAHRLLEGIEWLGTREETAAALDAAARTLPAIDLPHLAAARRALERALAAEPARAALSLDASRERLAALAGGPVDRVELLREAEYAFVADSGPERGTIDRLAIAWRGEEAVSAEVLDAKTGGTDGADGDGGDETGLRERYGPQLVGYRAAVVALHGVAAERVATRLLRIPSGEVIEVAAD